MTVLRTFELVQTNTPRPRERPWWQSMLLVDFERHVVGLGDSTLDLLWFDLKTAVSSCGQRAADTSVDSNERARTRTALRFLTAKRDMVRRELVRRGTFHARRNEAAFVK